MGYKKGERITDPNVLARLAKARQKALETRRAKAKLKNEAKTVAKLEAAKKAKETREKLKTLTTPSESNIKMAISQKTQPINH